MSQVESDDLGVRLLKGLVNELLRRVEDVEVAKSLSAAEIAQIRQLCADNSVSLASIRRGDFGDTAKRVAEEFPFQLDGGVVRIEGSA